MNCPGAIPLIEKLGLRGTGSNVYADMGTAMHTVAEECLTQNLPVSRNLIGRKVKVGPSSTITFVEDMIPIVTMFVNYIRKLPEGLLLYEQKVEPFPELGIFGTADCIAIYYCDDLEDMVLEIVDLKTGRTPVDAAKNTQLMIYAIGAYRNFGRLFSVGKIRVTIVQPVIGPPQSYTFDTDELLDFEQDVLKAVRRVREEPNTFVPSEKACRWCEARAVCPAQQKIINELAAEEFRVLAQPDLGALYRKAQIAKIAIKAIEEEVAKMLVAGKKVKGYRLAPGSTKRAWRKGDDVLRDLVAFLGRGYIMTKPELISPAQLEKVLAELEIDFSLTPYLEEKTPQPIIVEETSDKPRWSSAESAKQDFLRFTTED